MKFNKYPYVDRPSIELCISISNNDKGTKKMKIDESGSTTEGILLINTEKAKANRHAHDCHCRCHTQYVYYDVCDDNIKS